MTITTRTRLKMWSLLLGVFVLGAVTGSALTGLYRSRASGPEVRERAMHERFENMRRELNLTEEQTAAVRAIIDDTRNEYRALRAELRPRFEEPRQKARAKIRALLTPEQQKKFDAMIAQQDAQRDEEQKSRH
jgi:Spy/CpxP family protein refolding chaperone